MKLLCKECKSDDIHFVFECHKEIHIYSQYSFYPDDEVVEYFFLVEVYCKNCRKAIWKGCMDMPYPHDEDFWEGDLLETIKENADRINLLKE
ncbi:MAG: hypothetical protein ACTSR2_13375 [Candidatus Hodarchaeales archaeon]